MSRRNSQEPQTAATDTTQTTPARGYSATRDQLLNRLRRIDGQVRGVHGMVENARYWNNAPRAPGLAR